MKKYLFFRILRSLFSIFMVTTIAYMMIFTMIPRENIFREDENYSKLKANPDGLTNYVNNTYQKMGYLEWMNTAAFCQAATDTADDYRSCMDNDPNDFIEAFTARNKGWEVFSFKLSGLPYAVREIPIMERVARFYSNLIQIDHPWAIQDELNPDLERFIRVSNDETAGLTLNCSGCRSKYLIFFNGSFPFIHQNIIKINLGISHPTFSGLPVSQVIAWNQGKELPREITFETGVTQMSPINIHSCQYMTPSAMDHLLQAKFTDSYANCLYNKDTPSMMMISFMIGTTAVVMAYAIAIPSAIYMSRRKGKWQDKFGIFVLTVLISLPSLAFIYFFNFIGSQLLGMPEKFPILGAGDIRSYIMPTIILSLLSVSGIVLWLRRYMIDQQNADYVKFAKAKGLSEKEIANRHIFRNAFIPLTNGIAGSIIGTISGATMTETIFSIPGMGRMLTQSITNYNNNMVIGLLFLFTTMSVVSVLIGDLVLTKVDPRISLSNKGGRK